jgi:hypothetical protein
LYFYRYVLTIPTCSLVGIVDGCPRYRRSSRPIGPARTEVKLVAKGEKAARFFTTQSGYWSLLIIQSTGTGPVRSTATINRQGKLLAGGRRAAGTSGHGCAIAPMLASRHTGHSAGGVTGAFLPSSSASL